MIQALLIFKTVYTKLLDIICDFMGGLLDSIDDTVNMIKEKEPIQYEEVVMATTLISLITFLFFGITFLSVYFETSARKEDPSLPSSEVDSSSSSSDDSKKLKPRKNKRLSRKNSKT